MMHSVLLPNDTYKKLASVRLASKSKIRGHHKGSHRSQRVGSSMDFSDYRAYHLGDDVRQIDWNVYARSEKYFIKRFLDEQEMRVQILLDGSNSMTQNEKKWLFAKQLAAALGSIVLQRDDRLQFQCITGVKTTPFRQKGSSARQRYMHIVSELTGEPTDEIFTKGASKALVKGQTVLIILTDCLETIEQLQQLIRKLPNFAADIRIIQIVEQDMHEPDYSGDMEFYDVETKKVTNVSVTSATIEKFQKVKLQHEQKLGQLCNQYGIAHTTLYVEDGFQTAFFQRLKKANWIE
jgi:uncharacterized protein (DUF58 family)